MKKGMICLISSMILGVGLQAIPAVTPLAATEVSSIAPVASTVIVREGSGKIFNNTMDGFPVFADAACTQLITSYGKVAQDPAIMYGFDQLIYNKYATDKGGKIVAYHFGNYGWTPAYAGLRATSDTTYTEVGSQAIVTVGAKGAVVYTDAKRVNATSKHLAPGTKWKTFSKLQGDRGIFGISTASYNLGGNQWIANLDTVQAPVINPNARGTVKIHYVPGYGIAVWTAPGKSTAIKGKTLKHGTSWKYFATTSIDGTTWYNLGGNQWVSGEWAK